MLIVDLTMDYTTGVEGLPTNAADLYTFMSAPPAGAGYPGQFGSLQGLRGKYFVYDGEIDHWCAVVQTAVVIGIIVVTIAVWLLGSYGFYTFLDQESLDQYMASDLFKQQGDGPHIKELSYSVHDVLPGTERTIDMGEWHSAAPATGSFLFVLVQMRFQHGFQPLV